MEINDLFIIIFMSWVAFIVLAPAISFIRFIAGQIGYKSKSRLTWFKIMLLWFIVNIVWTVIYFLEYGGV